RAPPLWIDTLQVKGTIHSETIRGLVSATADWPLMMQMTMSGGRLEPMQRLHIAIGDGRQLPEKIEEKPAGGASKSVRRADAAFGVRADLEIQAMARTTRVEIDRLAARQVSLVIEAEALRQYAPKLPADLRGPITASLGALDVSGRVGPGTDAAPRFQGD